MKKYIIAFSLATMVGFSLTSCSEEFIATDFGNSEQAEQITSVEKLQSFVTGAYGSMRDVNYYGAYYQLFGEIRSDEMFSRRAAGYFTSYANLSMTSTDAYATGPYGVIYGVVTKANIVLNSPDNLTWSQTLNQATITDKVNKIKGEAYAVRALAFFDLLRLYGQQYSNGTKGIVIPTKYDPKANMARASVAETQAQIESDFAKSIALLEDNQFNNTANRTELNILSVKALMSRYYLYKQDYAKVRQYVNDIVAEGVYSVAAKDSYVISWTLNNASTNSLFELSVGTANAYGAAGLNAMMNFSGAYKNVAVLPTTYNLFSTSDVRRSAATFDVSGGYRFIKQKYADTSGADNIKLVRYEEVLLNGIEAELNGGSVTKAQAYWELILKNRLSDVVDANGNITSSVAQQIAALGPINDTKLKTERRKELLGEGFRMWDLLRWGQSVPVYNSTGGGLTATLNIGDTRLAFPIPQSETNVSGTLVTSNPGYDN
ncbi:RagB/SusD family nutrient uptake outer membrane protein [Chryseobacterium sp. SIMBA_029]|uniref:RagB/SusD family nutrient uptake outer membrane protein n=1 Tax=Chryseobacterium sp. SIMBA_029 TaxID=3085772 RepID=UPI00397E7FEC